MKIGIIGSGNIGGTLERLFREIGYEARAIGSKGPLSPDELARWADLVVLAAPFRKPEAMPSNGAVRGKIVIDAMNPYDEAFAIIDLGDRTSSEMTHDRIPDARLVKAFNTIYYVRLGANGRADLPVDEREAIFVAGDDAQAKQTVMALIEQLGFAPVDTGSLREGGRRQQPGTALYNRELRGGEARELVANAH